MAFMGDSLFQDAFHCSSSEMGIHKCPFLRNINNPTNLSFASLSYPALTCTVPKQWFSPSGFSYLFEKLEDPKGQFLRMHRTLTSPSNSFMGKMALSLSPVEKLETEALPEFNPLASGAASISMLAFGPGGPFGFNSFFGKILKKKSESSRKKEHKGDSSKHEALGNEWLEKGNCPIAKSYRAVSHVIPIVAASLRPPPGIKASLRPPPGIKLKCPAAIVAARAALARTSFVKTMRPQPLPSKVLVIGALGIAANIPLGVWREHTEKFSPSWFAAVHSAVPFIAMLRKSVVMPKTAMALTIAGSILGQMIGSRAERIRLKAKAEKENLVALSQVPTTPEQVEDYSSVGANGLAVGLSCKQGILWEPPPDRMVRASSSSSATVCF